MYKALRNELATVIEELTRIASGEQVDDDLLDTIQLITKTMEGLKEEC